MEKKTMCEKIWYCGKCGKKLPDEALFCMYCGAKRIKPLDEEEEIVKDDRLEDTNSKGNGVISESVTTKSDCILKFASVRVYDYIQFGSYHGEKIKWRVVDKQDGKILVISRNVLDCQPYNKTAASVTWDNCTLRSWLNNEFLNTAFDRDEIDRIAITTIKADMKYNVPVGKDTKDKVFLLSSMEVQKYLPDVGHRLGISTDYAVSRGAAPDISKKRFWWLRSIGVGGSRNAMGVFNDGNFCGWGFIVSNWTGCVRPALWINLES